MRWTKLLVGAGLAVCGARLYAAPSGTALAAVSRVLELRPCGHTLTAGWRPTRELSASGISESDWACAAGFLAEEELNRWTSGDLATEVEKARHYRHIWKESRNETESNEAGTRAVELERELRLKGTKLRRLAAVLRKTNEHKPEVFLVLGRIAREAPEESKATGPARTAWVHLALADSEPGRFKELGNWILESRGPDSPELLDFCHALWKEGLPPVNDRSDNAIEVARWLLSVAERFQSPVSAVDFDKCASGEAYCDRSALSSDAKQLPGLPGWNGSLQRKHLATRFEKSEDDAGALLLRSRTSAELAVKDSDLTDLRQAYGDWTKEKTEE